MGKPSGGNFTKTLKKSGIRDFWGAHQGDSWQSKGVGWGVIWGRCWGWGGAGDGAVARGVGRLVGALPRSRGRARTYHGGRSRLRRRCGAVNGEGAKLQAVGGPLTVRVFFLFSPSGGP